MQDHNLNDVRDILASVKGSVHPVAVSAFLNYWVIARRNDGSLFIAGVVCDTFIAVELGRSLVAPLSFVREVYVYGDHKHAILYSFTRD